MKKKKAAALKYSKEELKTPVISAYGSGVIAKKIIEAANKNNIKVVENNDFFDFEEHLYLGGEIPQDVYKIVADILSYIIKTNTEEC